LRETTTFTCPDCGEDLAMLENSTLVRCPHCGVAHSFTPGQPRVLRFSNGSTRAIKIQTLTGEVRELEKQRQALSERWGLVDLARNIGYILVWTGVAYALLSSFSRLTLLNFGVYAILAGILLHGVSQLVGRDYYIQKAFLDELIFIKETEIEQRRSRPLKSGKISF
jgi:hypothetical protein